MYLVWALKLFEHQTCFETSFSRLILTVASTPHKTYFACQAEWTAQIAAHFEELKKKNLDIPDADVLRLALFALFLSFSCINKLKYLLTMNQPLTQSSQRDEELKEAQRARKEYEAGLQMTSAMMKQLTQLQNHLLGR